MLKRSSRTVSQAISSGEDRAVQNVGQHQGRIAVTQMYYLRKRQGGLEVYMQPVVVVLIMMIMMMMIKRKINPFKIYQADFKKRSRPFNIGNWANEPNSYITYPHSSPGHRCDSCIVRPAFFIPWEKQLLTGIQVLTASLISSSVVNQPPTWNLFQWTEDVIIARRQVTHERRK